MTDIVLADDHHLVRQGVKAQLTSEPTFRLVGEVDDGLKVLAMVEALKPQVLILDLKMPGLNGLDVCKQVTEKMPGTKVIMLSMHSDEAYVVQALRNGASGYVLKESKGSDLVDAVREVLAGRRFLSPPLSERSVESYLQKAASARMDPYETLSPRERQVLQLAAEGNSNPAISEKLGISPRTVETHRANLMKKLNMRGQTDLIRFALKRGVVSND